MEKYKNSNLSINERVEDLLSKMNLHEKAEQLNIIRGVEFANNPSNKHACSVEYDTTYRFEDIKKIFGDRSVGCVHDTYSNPKTLNTLQHYFVEETRLGIPAIFTGEALHGLGAIGTSNFPTPICMGATFDEQLIKEVGHSIASESRSLGIHEILAPNLDVSRDARWGRGEETFGEDTYLSKIMAKSLVSGESGDNHIERPDAVICEPKHYIAHGSSEGGANCNNVRVGQREIYENCLPVFEAAFKAGAKNVMSAYHAIDGEPVASSYHYLTEVLKEEYNLPGYIRSDWGSIMRLKNCFHMKPDERSCTITAINAGLDVMGCFEYPAKDFSNMIVDAVSKHEIELSRIDDAVRRILKIKFEAGLFENPYTNEENYKNIVCCKKHDEISLKTAEEGIVLIKNEKETLPITSKKYKKIALVGPFSETPVTGGYSAVTTRHISGVYEELKSMLGDEIDIYHENGCDIIREKEYQYVKAEAHLIHEKRAAINTDMENAVKLCNECDITIFVGGDTNEVCGEGIDRSTLSLYGDQPELIRRLCATGKPVVLVILNGRPQVLAEESKIAKSILCCWHGGDFASKAIVNALVGNINPGGKLPISFPSGEGRVPCYYCMIPGGSNPEYVEGKRAPLYPFGFGLSYTTFEYIDLVIEQKSRYDFNAFVTIKNIGKVTGDEVVQLYLTDVESSVATPPVRLIGFKRINLQPGEIKTVKLSFGYDDIKTYMPSRKFEVETGEFIISAASASNDLRISKNIFID